MEMLWYCGIAVLCFVCLVLGFGGGMLMRRIECWGQLTTLYQAANDLKIECDVNEMYVAQALKELRQEKERLQLQFKEDQKLKQRLQRTSDRVRVLKENITERVDRLNTEDSALAKMAEVLARIQDDDLAPEVVQEEIKWIEKNISQIQKPKPS